MTIANRQFEAMGPRIYYPEGPFGAAGQTPLPSFIPGSVVEGDAEAEFTYVLFAPGANVTLNQGDFLAWDNSYVAVQSLAGAAYHPVGTSFGTVFYGGRVGDPAAAPGQGNTWSFLFLAGSVYGLWVQRAGTSILNLTVTNANTPVYTFTTASNFVQKSAAATAGSVTVAGVGSPPTSFALTSTVTVTGSNVITLAAGAAPGKGIYKGMYLSGTGIANATYITDFTGNTITMSAAATANGTVTVTAASNTFWGTMVSGQKVWTGVASVPGVYPNQTLSGTGTSGTIVSITGIPGNYTVTQSAASGAGNASASAVTTTTYLEGFLRWPYAQTQN